MKKSILKTVATLAVISSAVFGVMLQSGCSHANMAAVNAWGQRHRITLYSGGKIVGQWESSGKIENEEAGDGRYFQDDKTGLLVTISGTYAIEVIK